MIGSTVKTQFERHKKDISDVTDNLLIQWLDHLNRWFHNYLSGVDAERLLAVRNYTISTDPQTSALPTGYQSMQPWQCGFYKNTANKLGFDAQTANFTAALTLTGGTSAATATIDSVTDDGTTGIITVSSVTGTFQDGETITDSSTGSATVDVYSVLTDTKLQQTGPGSSNVGYFVTGTNIIFTGSTAGDIYTLRYLPTATEITALADTLLIPDEYIHYVIMALDARYAVWDEDPGAESLNDFRFVRALDELARNIRKEAAVYGLTDYSNMY